MARCIALCNADLCVITAACPGAPSKLQFADLSCLPGEQVMGLARKANYSGRFEKLMNLASNVFNKLVDRAAETPRNYILDQTK